SGLSETARERNSRNRISQRSLQRSTCLTRRRRGRAETSSSARTALQATLISASRDGSLEAGPRRYSSTQLNRPHESKYTFVTTSSCCQPDGMAANLPISRSRYLIACRTVRYGLSVQPYPL